MHPAGTPGPDSPRRRGPPVIPVNFGALSDRSRARSGACSRGRRIEAAGSLLGGEAGPTPDTSRRAQACSVFDSPSGVRLVGSGFCGHLLEFSHAFPGCSRDESGLIFRIDLPNGCGRLRASRVRCDRYHRTPPAASAPRRLARRVLSHRIGGIEVSRSRAFLLLCAALLTSSSSSAQTIAASFRVQSDWGTGYVGEIQLTNAAQTPISGWTIEFDLGGQIV